VVKNEADHERPGPKSCELRENESPLGACRGEGAGGGGTSLLGSLTRPLTLIRFSSFL